MDKHTPGPWRVDGEHIYAGDHLQIATVELYRGQLTEAQEAEDTANARLLAAAPELLDALDNLLAYLNGYDRDYPEAAPHFDRAREALAKATRGAA